MDHVGVIFYKRIIDAVYSLLDFLERFLYIKYPPVFIVGNSFLYFEYNKASFPCQKYEAIEIQWSTFIVYSNMQKYEQIQNNQGFKKC